MQYSLAYELYDTSTHFLLELLQNADDNEYTFNPTLKLTYTPGVFQVDCNETGFTKENVEAICGIRNSTKLHSKDYTGEKGIGFKSVFKVADEVYISSRQYAFKFDKREKFGMIAPTWADFPGRTSPDCTSIYLNLSKHYATEELVEQLQCFDSGLLLFLRTIRNIDVSAALPEGRSWNKSLKRIDMSKNEDGSSIRVLQVDENSTEYIIRPYRVLDLPYEARRLGYSHAEILLAFPVTDFSTASQLAKQNVYNILPINDYGLPVILHFIYLLWSPLTDFSSRYMEISFLPQIASLSTLHLNGISPCGMG